jgi:hypothetical protein
MPSFRGMRQTVRGGSGAGNGYNAHANLVAPPTTGHPIHGDMSFDEWHDSASRKKGPREGLFLVRGDKSPYPHETAKKLAREQYNSDVRKNNEKNRPKTTEEEYG